MTYADSFVAGMFTACLIFFVVGLVYRLRNK
jgi:hypothetical protein